MPAGSLTSREQVTPRFDATFADTTWLPATTWLPHATWATGATHKRAAPRLDTAWGDATQVLDLRRRGGGNLATVSSRGRARTRLGKIKSCSCAIVNHTWHGFAQSLLQKKELLCSSKHTASRGCGCRRSMCRPRVFATMSVFARRVFARCLRTPTCLRDDADLRLGQRLHTPTRLRHDAGLRPTCLWEVSSHAHASSPRRGSSPDLSLGSVFARPPVFATTRVFARPVFGKCLRTPTRLRHDAGLRPTCLWEVSSHAHASSPRRGSSPDLSLGSVFARPPVFATTRVFARPVFGKCLRTPTRLRHDAGLRPTCLWEVSSHAHASSPRRGSSPDLSLGSVFARPRVFATTRVFARRVFGKCLRTPTRLRHDAGLRPTCLWEMSSHAHPSSPRRGSSPDVSLGSVFARPRVFATTRVFARPVFGKCLRTPTCLRDDAGLRPTCLRRLSARAHIV